MISVCSQVSLPSSSHPFIHSFHKEIRRSPRASGLDIKVLEVRQNLLLNQGLDKELVYHVHFLQEGKCAHSGSPFSAHCLNSRLYGVDHVCVCVCVCVCACAHPQTHTKTESLPRTRWLLDAQDIRGPSLVTLWPGGGKTASS